jgi:2-polyprenyl-6-methoxyphenol hydroxylase-like FAD-dependent oxidoreductase/aryl-alcohol dehydrogenase-like predicted oxidoreductase/nucleoside-diphosphate-sugar epimerase
VASGGGGGGGPGGGAPAATAAAPAVVDVAVVGAGLAGLSAAIFLQKQGVAVTLFDRHTSLEGQGVETTVGVLFQECYRRSGVDLTTDLQRIGVPISFYVVRDAAGEVSSRERVDATAQAFGRCSFDVSRPELMRLLLGKFEDMGGVFRGGCAVETVQIVGDVARIQFVGGETVETSSLIACDGIHSRIRRQLFDDTPPQFPGVSLVYGILPGAAGLVADEPDSFQMMLADGFSVLTSHYLGERPETWFAVLSRAEAPLLNRSLWAEGKDDAEAGAAALLGSGPPVLQRYLEHEPPPRFTYSGGLQTREMPPDFQWARGPVLLIGDAVHGLTPWGGYSGQMAVEDAFVVAQHRGRAERFADVMAERRPRVLAFQGKSTEQKADGLGEAGAVARAHLERIDELVSCPAFELHVFVVGVAGRIGSAVARACLARGARVSGLARSPAAALAAIDVGRGSASGVTVHQGDAADSSWAAHLQGVDVVVCALRGMPGAVLPLQMHVLELAMAAGIPRFVAADWLPDYSPLISTTAAAGARQPPQELEEEEGEEGPAPPSASAHPMLTERIAFRKHLRALQHHQEGGGIAGVHVHVGCLLEVDELFGFMGLWDGEARTLSYWGDPETAAVAFDVTTVRDAAEATAEALFSGAVGDVRVATATVTMQEIAGAMNTAGDGAVTLHRLGTLAELEAAIAAATVGSLDAIRLHCQRSLFAGDCNTVGAGAAGLHRWLDTPAAAQQQLLHGLPPQPWTTPNMEGEGLIQTDLKTDGVDGDTALRTISLGGDDSRLDFEGTWLELGRRALTAGRWAETRLVATVIRAVDPSTYTSGKLWLAGVACFFTGDFEEGVARFDAEMASNPVDAEELLWRELCAIAAGHPPSCQRSSSSSSSSSSGGGGGGGEGGLVAQLAQPDPRPIFNRILEYFDGSLDRLALLQIAQAGGALERFYASMYTALHVQALGEESALSQRLLAVAQQQQCRDNLGLACRSMRVLPYIKIGGDSGGYSCPRLIVGCAGLDTTDSAAASIERLRAAAAHGLCAVDVADIYPGSEELVKLAGARIVHTKFVPDRSALAGLDAVAVSRAVHRSRARLGRRPQAVQLHWWGDANADSNEGGPGKLAEVAALLERARVEQGLFRCLGVTNMDVEHLRIVADNASVGLCQVAISLLDRRALHGGLLRFCAERSIAVVGYGALCGGFLSEKWLGAEEPSDEGGAAAQRKYLARIRVQGGWAEFQCLLRGVAAVARRHGNARFASVALAWSLRQADAVIVGCPRANGDDDQLVAALAALELQLTDVDMALLERPPPQELVGAAATAAGVYHDERDPQHPIGKALAPWMDTAHLGPSHVRACELLVTTGFSNSLVRSLAEIQCVMYLVVCRRKRRSHELKATPTRRSWQKRWRRSVSCRGTRKRCCARAMLACEWSALELHQGSGR